MDAPTRTPPAIPLGEEQQSRASVSFALPINTSLPITEQDTSLPITEQGEINTELEPASPDASSDLKKKRASQAYDKQFLLQRAMSTKKALSTKKPSSSTMSPSIATNINQGTPATSGAGSFSTIPENIGGPVGDRLLSEFDHGEPEYAFPHNAKAVSTPYLEAYYETVRAVIHEAVFDNNFRGGIFKAQVTATRPVRLILNTIMFSKDISQDQHETIKQYMRTWSKAIGDSGSNGDGFILDQTFLETTNLDVALTQLRRMFDEEKENPLPNPMPYRLRYKDAATLRREAELRQHLDELRARKDGEATSSAPVADSAVPGKPVPTASSSSTPAGQKRSSASSSASGLGRGSSSKKNIFEINNSKEDILAGIASSTNLSKEGAQKAIADISKVKGSKLTSKDIDKLDDDTIEALHQHMCKDAQTANKQMPLGAALQETIRRLEGMGRDA